MKLPFLVKTLGLSICVAGLTLGSTFALGGVLQRHYAVQSHQLPTPEHWFEPVTSTSPQLITRGRALFLDSCAHCHGADARGDEGPDLHQVETSDRYIANLITHGIPHEMPSFAKKHGREDITALTAYIRSLPTKD
jgi:mono/diheme cytochrome c family protein